MLRKKILVTGGTGFIGSHTVVELINNGFDVVIVDDLSNSREEVIESIRKITGVLPEFVQMDLCDESKVSQLFSQYHERISAVIHFAAKKLVGESVEKPLLYYHNNLYPLINIIRECFGDNIDKFVFSSSCTVYGQADKLPVDEYSELKHPESPYGKTKRMSEDILSDISNAEDFNCISLRYFNPVGAHESALIGEYPLGTPSNLMPIMTQTAIGKRASFEVFGDDYNTPDGSCIRDYIHVVDLAIAHVAALKKLLENKNTSKFEAFNLGTGNGISVFRMIETFERVNKVKLNYVIGKRRPGDVEKVWASTEKANRLLGWYAQRSLEEMVSSAWIWEQKLAEKERKTVHK